MLMPKRLRYVQSQTKAFGEFQSQETHSPGQNVVSWSR